MAQIRVPPMVRQARAVHLVERANEARGALLGLKPFIQSFRRCPLERHVAGMARAEPSAVQRRAGIEVETSRGGVDAGVAPGVGMGRLAAGRSIEAALDGPAGCPEGE